MKRIPELRDLSDDHHTGLVLARRCRQAAHPRKATAPGGTATPEVAPEDVWEQVRAAFRDHLEPHFQIEEQHLLPALDAIGEPALAARIRDDHAALRALRDAADPTPDALARFGTLLKDHIRFEERQVFDPLQACLPKAALAAIAAACAKLRS